MKLSISNIGIKDSDLLRVYAKMQGLGYTGLEIAPTKFVGEQPYDSVAKAARIAQQILDDFGLVIPSMQSIWYGKSGNIFVKDDSEALLEYTKRAVQFAKGVNCKSLVFGCPKHRNIPQNSTAEESISFFTQVAKYAFDNGTAIALEANVPEYGTNFINTSKDAFDFAKKVPYLKVNYDTGTLIAQNESLDTLANNIDLVSHIHISEPLLAPIKPREMHIELATLLKQKEYKGFVSIEMQAQPYDELCGILKYISEVFT